MNGRTAIFITLGALSATLLGNAARIRELTSKLGDDWSKLHPEMKTRALEVIDLANAAFRDDGLRVGVHDGYRDVSQQLQEIQEGDSFLSHPLNGYHPWGLAADFVFIDRTGRWTWLPDPNDPANTAYWDPRWDRLGGIIEAVGLEWGGRWERRDGPHGQLPLLRTAELRQAYGDDPARFIAANTGGLLA